MAAITGKIAVEEHEDLTLVVSSPKLLMEVRLRRGFRAVPTALPPFFMRDPAHRDWKRKLFPRF